MTQLSTDFKIRASREDTGKVLGVLNQYNVDSEIFQGTETTFSITAGEAMGLSNQGDNVVRKFADAVLLAGGRFQGVGTKMLNDLSKEGRKQQILNNNPSQP